jgi:hypothetical protein
LNPPSSSHFLAAESFFRYVSQNAVDARRICFWNFSSSRVASARKSAGETHVIPAILFPATSTCLIILWTKRGAHL